MKLYDPCVENAAHGLGCCCFRRYSFQVFCDEGHRFRLHLHILRGLQCAGILADISHVFYHSLLLDDEATDKGKESLTM